MNWIREFLIKSNMRIIGLYGHGNCGKSETLNVLIELFREANIIYYFKY